MKAGTIVVLLLVLSSFAVAQQPAYTSTEGKYRIRFPGAPKVTDQIVKTDLGEVTVRIATYANTDGSTFMISYSDYPAEAVKAENHAKLFDGIRDKVKGDEGKIAGNERELKIGKEECPGREFIVEKGRQRIKLQLIIRDQRMYQIVAIGTSDFIKGRDANAFFDSLELTK